MEFEYHNRKPQDDVPVDQIIHYIVKDYQRMFLTFHDMKERAEKAEAKIEDLKAKHHTQIEKKDKEIAQLKRETNSPEKIKQLEEKLQNAQHQNRLLANAVIAQNTGNGLPGNLSQAMGSPVDIKELEKKMGTQLSDAFVKLNAAEARLVKCQEILETLKGENPDTVQIKGFLPKFSRAFGQIDSATTHIENFYKLANRKPLS